MKMHNTSPSGDPQKQELIRKRHYAFRINVLFFCTFFLFSILIVRLAILQFVQGDELAMLEDQSTETQTSIPPIRGNILDRNGYPIAYSTSSQSLFFHYEGKRPKDEVIAMAYWLSDIFRKYGEANTPMPTPEEIVKIMDVGYDINLNKTRIIHFSFSPRRIKAGLSQAEIAYILEHRDELRGIEIVEESIRKYDSKQIAVQLVGYLRPFDRAIEPMHGLDFYKNIEQASDPSMKYLLTEDVGFDGIELMYQAELRGKNGMKSYPVNASQQIIGDMTITPPEKGNNLHLTIDKDVQLIAQQAILDQLEYMKSDAARVLKYPAKGKNATTGYAVAMEVKTGKVVAMASMPDYDPNVWSGGISMDNWNAIQPFYQNGTIREVYPDYKDSAERAKHPSSLVPLGSTIKPLTVLIGLNERLITASEKYRDPGTYFFGRDKVSKVSNAEHKNHGTIDAMRAITFSVNTYMSEYIGNRLYLRSGQKGVDIWNEYMERFGLGVVTGSGLPREIAGIKEYETEVKRGSAQSALVYASFGQQGKYTTLQLAQYAATLANRGKRPKPQFVEKTTTYSGEFIKGYEPIFIEESVFPDEYWNVIHQGMLKVSKQGFIGFPYEVAAKTGTSQQQVAGGILVENAVFIAYAPADDPKLAVAVVIPEGGYGGWGAAPIARKIFDAYDKYIGLRDQPNPDAGAEPAVEPASGHPIEADDASLEDSADPLEADTQRESGSAAE